MSSCSLLSHFFSSLSSSLPFSFLTGRGSNPEPNICEAGALALSHSTLPHFKCCVPRICLWPLPSPHRCLLLLFSGCQYHPYTDNSHICSLWGQPMKPACFLGNQRWPCEKHLKCVQTQSMVLHLKLCIPAHVAKLLPFTKFPNCKSLSVLSLSTRYFESENSLLWGDYCG